MLQTSNAPPAASASPHPLLSRPHRLAPFSPALLQEQSAFISEHWERKPLHIPADGARKAFFSGLFSFAKLLVLADKMEAGLAAAIREARGEDAGHEDEEGAEEGGEKKKENGKEEGSKKEGAKKGEGMYAGEDEGLDVDEETVDAVGPLEFGKDLMAMRYVDGQRENAHNEDVSGQGLGCAYCSGGWGS